MILALLSFAAQATPTCYPGDTAAAEKDAILIIAPEGVVAGGHCDQNHQWVFRYVLASLDEYKAADMDVAFAKFGVKVRGVSTSCSP